jgi:succinate dehydrogenase/fumarate reductase flavoprotein subunit
MPPSGNLYGTYDYPGNTGDGYLLGYRSGAKLTSMEFTICYCLLKDVQAPGMAMMIQKGAKLLNAAGKALFENEFYNLSDVNKIQNSKEGPLRLRLSHMPEEGLKEIENIIFSCERPVTERFLKGRGLNLRNNDLELATSELFLCGGHGLSGLYIDETASTSIPGLYAAGDTAPVPRGYLSGAFVFGEVAAESASKFAEKRSRPVPDKSSYLDVHKKIEQFKRQTNAPVPIRDFEFKVRRRINEYLTPPKNEYKLNKLLGFLEIMREELKTTVKIKDQRDLFLALEAENIVDSAILSTVASRERKESRWGFWHQRGDYPERNDNKWANHIDLEFNPDSTRPAISYRPVNRMSEIGDIK